MSLWVNEALIRWQEMSSLCSDFPTVISFFEPIQYLQIDPKSGGITVSLVQWYSSHPVYLHQRESKMRSNIGQEQLLDEGPEWRKVNPHKAEIVLGEIKTNQQLK